MSPFFVRFPLYASLAMALCGAQVIAAQTPRPATAPALEAAVTLPEAPSPIGAQQTTPASSSSSTAAQADASAPAAQTAVEKRLAECSKLPADQQKACIKSAGDIQVKTEEGQRNLFILPAFNTVIAGKSPPLTPGQKWNLVYHTAKDPYTFAIAFIVTGLGEARDNTNYGWGPSGYFEDVGAAYLDNVDGAVIGNAVLPILLHQDPRYFRIGHGNVLHRILAAAGSTIICKGDNGRNQFNISNVGGNFISGAISNAYYPASQRGLHLTLDNALVVTAEGGAGAQLLEFGPDLNALLARRRQRHLAAKAAKNGTAAPAASH